MEFLKFEKKVEAPVDKSREAVVEKKVGNKKKEYAVSQPAGTAADAPAAPLRERDEELFMIENILSENISGIYRELSAERQKAFQRRGEEVALTIKGMLKRARVRAHEILELIKNWLKMLPGVNRYFLEQEAKIKTDKVLQMKREGQEIER